MARTLTAKEWKSVGNGLKQHKKMDALQTEFEWNKEAGREDPLLFEYMGIKDRDLSKPGKTFELELERLKAIGRKHELERELKIEVSFDTNGRGRKDGRD